MWLQYQYSADFTNLIRETEKLEGIKVNLKGRLGIDVSFRIKVIRVMLEGTQELCQCQLVVARLIHSFHILSVSIRDKTPLGSEDLLFVNPNTNMVFVRNKQMSAGRGLAAPHQKYIRQWLSDCILTGRT